MRKPLINFALSLILGFFLLQTVFAGDTGKITGTVTDCRVEVAGSRQGHPGSVAGLDI